MEDKKEYTAEEVARALLERTRELAADALKKNELSPKEAAKQIKGPAKVNEVLPKVAPEARKEVFEELRQMDKADPRNQTEAQMQEVSVPQSDAPKAQPKVIAKQPLQLKKFMEKCAMKKQEKGVNRPFPIGDMIGDKGMSRAGFYSNVASSDRNDESTRERARETALKEHKTVISEMKDMPKPNLPKSEQG